MVGEDRVMMRMKELKRWQVIRQVMEQRITQVKAGSLVGLTDRHVRRLLQRVEAGGRPEADASGARHAIEPADLGEGQGPGAAVVCAAVGGFWADVGSQSHS